MQIPHKYTEIYQQSNYYLDISFPSFARFSFLSRYILHRITIFSIFILPSSVLIPCLMHLYGFVLNFTKVYGVRVIKYHHYISFSDEVKFSELSQDIQISAGGSVFLHCVTSSAVEQCRWSLTPVNSNTTVVVKQFPAAGSEARDCSVRLTHALAEQEGLWTCGARVRGKQNYTDAPPAKLSLLEPGIIES